MEHPGRKRAWYRRRSTLLVTLVLLALVGWFVWHFENFHCILPEKQVYGSAQLTPAQLDERIHDHHIRTIVNLRGPNPQHRWYREEVKVAKRLGVTHHDFPFSSVTLPPRSEMKRLIQVLKNSAKPLLVHCQSGIDRTGLAAMVCELALDTDGSPEKAWERISIWGGHLPWRKTVEMKRQFIDHYKHWLGEQKINHSPEEFCRWVETEYKGTWE